MPTPRQLYLLGRDISHSLSPPFHNELFTTLELPWKFDLLDTASAEDLCPLMRKPFFVGASVTMPHKVTFMRHVDSVTETAELTQAINTIFVRNDPKTGERRIIGTNTDCIGIRDSIVRAHPETAAKVMGHPAMVIGGGGACRAAVYALSTMMGASVVYLVNRDAKELCQVVEDFKTAGFLGNCICVSSPEQALTLESPVVIVGTVPDISPQSKEELRARAVITTFLGKVSKGVLLDMCYHPSPETELIALGRQSDWKVVHGIEAFFYQAVASASLWTKRDPADLPVQTAKVTIYSVYNI